MLRSIRINTSSKLDLPRGKKVSRVGDDRVEVISEIVVLFGRQRISRGGRVFQLSAPAGSCR